MSEQKALVPYEKQKELASYAAKSNQYKHIRNPQQAMLLMQYGRDMGMGPAEALQAVYEVNGVPTLKAGTITARFKAMKWRDTQMNKYNYRVLEKSDTICRLRFFERADDGVMEEVGTNEFTIEDAKRAGLIKPNSGWTKFPRDMLFARCATGGIRTYGPDCLGGVIPYCTEEMTNTDQEGTPVLPPKGEVVDAEWEEKPEEGPVSHEELKKLGDLAAAKGLLIHAVLSQLGVDLSKQQPVSRSVYEAALRLVEQV